jgi:hypothetical protein
MEASKGFVLFLQYGSHITPREEWGEGHEQGRESMNVWDFQINKFGCHHERGGAGCWVVTEVK